MKLRGKLLLLTITLIVASLVVLGLFLTLEARRALVESYSQKLLAVLHKTGDSLKFYFDSIDNILLFASKNPTFYRAMEGFDRAWTNLGKFLKQDPAKALRDAYIKNNPYPPDQRYKLLRLDKSKYMKLLTYDIPHGSYHKMFQELVQGYGFYDVYFVTREGTIVYSYRKEDDFGTGLLKGKYSKTALADVFRKLQKLEKNEVVYSDFSFYPASGNKPFIFAGVKVLKYDIIMGYMIVQIPPDKINELLLEKTGMGETGEVYLVGKDGYLRSDTRFLKDSILKKKIDTEPVRLALQGKSGVMRNKDYKGDETLSAYMPFKHKQLQFAMIGDVDYSEATKASTTMTIYGLLTFAIVLAVAIIVTIIFVQRIVVRIGRLVQNIEKFAEGQLNVKFEIKAKDEIAQIGAALSKMGESLRTSMANIKETGEELWKFSKNLDEFTTKQAQDLKVMSDNIENISASIQNTSAAIEEVTSGAEEVASSAQNLSHMSQELTNMATDMSKSADTGRKAIEEITSLIEEVAEKTGNAASIVSNVAKKSQNIREIVDTINSIAEQTNLLALNAAIEAARAGEAGKGFAVVADEIRKLAEESKKATENINQILGDIQSGADQANTAMTEVSESVSNTKERAEGTMKEFDTILEKIKEVLGMTENLAATAEELSAATQEISSSMTNAAKSVTEVSDSAAKITEMMKNLTEQSEDLSERGTNLRKLADRLEELVGWFTL